MIFGGGLESRLAKFIFTPIRTATKRASGGKAANNKTAGRRLGPKRGEGEFVAAGQIIWRQRGTNWFPGENAGIGRDHTIFAREPGYVRYYRDPFHAKRRFIGIALGASERLPTPHFEPRRRRFGYTPIDNEEVAQFELNYLTRKETQRVAQRDQLLAERAAKQEQRASEYKSVLSSVGINDVSVDQLSRLDSIYQFMCGGSSYAEAREIVDNQAEEDFGLDLRTNRLTPENHSAKTAEYGKLASRIDAAVAFSAGRKLVPTSSLDTKAREEAVAKIESLAKPFMDSIEGTPANVVAEVVQLLESVPAFTPADIARLKRKYLRRPGSVWLTNDNRAFLETRAKKGEGKICRVWDHTRQSTEEYFVPENGKLNLRDMP